MNWLGELRRGATRRAMLGALRAAEALPPEKSLSLGRALGRAAMLNPVLRGRLAANLRAAGIAPTDALLRKYFRRLGAWAGHSLGVYAAGFDRSLAADIISLHPATLHRLDAAVAHGKGVVLAAPHLFFHEMGAALIHRRYPVTALVRESKDPTWGAVKNRWYHESLGLKTVLRPRRSSGMGEVAAMLRVLKGGGVLGITPDVATARDSGLPVRMFGRTVSLSPGMVLLAQRTGAALVSVGPDWYPDPASPIGERARITFSDPLDLPKAADLRGGLQRWCADFEAVLRRDPAAWLFWLDKAWTKVLRQPTEPTGAMAA